MLSSSSRANKFMLIAVSTHLSAELLTRAGSVLSSFNKHAGPLIIYKPNPEFKGLEGNV